MSGVVSYEYDQDNSLDRGAANAIQYGGGTSTEVDTPPPGQDGNP